MRFVSKSGQTNFTVSDGKVSQLDLEVIDSRLSHKELREDRREEHLSDVMSVLESTGAVGREGGNLFAAPKSDAPDPNDLLAFITQTNERDAEIDAQKNPKFVIPDGSGEDSELDIEAAVSQDDYLSDLIGANLDSFGGDQEKLLDQLENETKEHLAVEDSQQPIHQVSGSGDESDEFLDLTHSATVLSDAQAEQEVAVANLLTAKDEELKAAVAEKEAEIAALQAQIAEMEQAAEALQETHKQDLAAAQEAAEKEADEAYAKGMEEGAANRQGEVDELQEQIVKISQEIPLGLNNYFEELEEQMKDEICNFSLSIAENFIRREINDRDVLKETVKSALSPIMNYKGVILYLNPEIAEYATSTGELSLPNGLIIEADPQLEPGEAMIESDMGFIDATLERRLETLRGSFDNPVSS